MSNRDYPTEQELELIRNWDYMDMVGLIDFVVDIWWMKYGIRWTKRKVKDRWIPNKHYLLFRCSTGGWSGNEDIIDAMAQNRIFWSTSFFNHRVGGHFEFHIPIFSKEDTDAEAKAP